MTLTREGIQLKICHLYGTFNFSTLYICMGTESLFDCGFRGKRALYEAGLDLSGGPGTIGSPESLRGSLEMYEKSLAGSLSFCRIYSLHILTQNLVQDRPRKQIASLYTIAVLRSDMY